MAIFFAEDPLRKGAPSPTIPTFIIGPRQAQDTYRRVDMDRDEGFVEVVGGQEAGFEDPEQMIIKAFLWNREAGELAKKPHQAIWDEAWRLYNNEWDFSDKADWQSQRSLPKVTMAVERLTAVLERILSMSRQWFSVVTENPKKQIWVNVGKDLMNHWLSHEKLNFFLLFQDCLKVGLLSQIMAVEVTCEVDGIPDPEYDPGGTPQLESGGLATLFMREEPVERGPNTEPQWFPVLRLWNPDRLTFDPTGRNRWVSMRLSYTKGEFYAEAKQRAFDPLAVEKVMKETHREYESAGREARKRQQPINIGREDQVTLDIFWGDLYDEKGRRLLKNRYFIVANEKYLVLKPTENPFFHKKCPLVVAGLLRVPFSIYHKSLIGISLDSFGMWVEFLNLLMDYFQALFLGQYEMNMKNLHPDENPDELEWFPGKLWKKNGPDRLIELVQAGQADPQVWQFLSTLSQELQEGTAMMDAMAGVPRTRGKLSSMEFTRRMAEGGVFFDFIFRNLEDNFIRPLLKRLFQVILQYMPMRDWSKWIDTQKEKYASDPVMLQHLDMIRDLTPRERYDLLANDLEFSTRVFSAVFDRQQEIEKITYMLGILGRVPQAAQHLKWSNILGKLIEAFGWDREEMISEVPIPFMGDSPTRPQLPAPNPNGSDGGRGVAQQAAMPGSAHMNTSAGFLGGSAGGPPAGMEQLMPGVRRSGNPQPGGSGA